MADKQQPKPLTVSGLTAALKSMIEERFTRIYVEAEISGWKRYPSGHAYFTLKDDGAQVSAVMFASAFERCKAKDSLKDGAKVLVYANVTVYPPRGNYQLVVLAARLVGEGDLMQRYLELKARLEREGLFDPSRKRPLPFLPRRIGIITSEAGAVIHDMCTVLTRRFPALEILLYPCLVQGDAAPETIIAGLEYFNRRGGFDLLIVARGGGSFEDLFCFNDEALVRAVAASKIPTISAVGHETDFTLCDFAADLRAGTPSIAAEIAVPRMDELKARQRDLSASLTRALQSRADFFAQRLDQLTDALGASLALSLSRLESRFSALSPRLVPALNLALERISSRLGQACVRLEAYSPYGVLERGYSLTTREDGSVVSSATALEPGETLVTRLRSGSVVSTVAKTLP